MTILVHVMKKKELKMTVSHSDDGMDEISPFAKTNIVELKDKDISNLLIKIRSGQARPFPLFLFSGC